MSLERRDGYWLWVGGPVAPGAAATTIGSVILMRGRYAQDARLLRHELEHVRQYREYGWVGFFRRYLRAYARARLAAYPHLSAYRRIPFEVEAEWRARRMAVDRQDTRDMAPLTP
jgi:hypothetical protein